MNREQMRASMRIGKSLQKLPWNKFEEYPIHLVREIEIRSGFARKPVDVVYKNNKYIVQIFHRHKEMYGLQAKM